MEEAIAIADELLKDKQLIVLQKIKKGKYKTYATKKGDFETGKVFVLQNENSAPRVKFWLVRFKITIGDYRDVVPSGKV
jgi:hypothetical protein